MWRLATIVCDSLLDAELTLVTLVCRHQTGHELVQGDVAVDTGPGAYYFNHHCKSTSQSGTNIYDDKGEVKESH